MNYRFDFPPQPQRMPINGLWLALPEQNLPLICWKVSPAGGIMCKHFTLLGEMVGLVGDAVDEGLEYLHIACQQKKFSQQLPIAILHSILCRRLSSTSWKPTDPLKPAELEAWP